MSESGAIMAFAIPAPAIAGSRSFAQLHGIYTCSWIRQHTTIRSSIHTLYRFNQRSSEPTSIICSMSSSTSQISSLLDKLPHSSLKSLLRDTMLEKSVDKLTRIYSSSEDGADCEVFHNKVDLAVPSLLVGETILGDVFGAYNSLGWDSREDYRDSLKCFLFHLDPTTQTILVSQKSGGSGAALFDFADYAVRFGSDGLCIPMNTKYAGKMTLASSSLGSYYSVLENGQTSILGRGVPATEIKELQVFVSSEWVQGQGNDPKNAAPKSSDGGWLGFLNRK